jgi:hypothetical protein
MHKLRIRRLFAEQLREHMAAFRPTIEAQDPEESREIVLQIMRVAHPICKKLESTIKSASGKEVVA